MLLTVLLYASALVPPVVYAVSGSAEAEVNRVFGLIAGLLLIVDYLTAIAVGVTFLYFFWGLTEYIRKESSSGELEKAKNKMVWGALGVFVVVSVWSIIYIFEAIFLGGAIGSTDIETIRLTS